MKYFRWQAFFVFCAFNNLTESSTKEQEGLLIGVKLYFSLPKDKCNVQENTRLTEIYILKNILNKNNLLYNLSGKVTGLDSHCNTKNYFISASSPQTSHMVCF